jgi:Tfp pilus assembly protein PilN
MSVYFRINLNKTALEDRAEAQARRKLWVTVAIYLIVIIGLAVVLYLNDQKVTQKLEAKKSELAEIENSLKALEKSTRYVSEEDVVALASWEENRLLWTPKLKALAEILPSNMVYTKIAFLQDQLMLSGIAEIKPGQKELDLVLNLVNTIKAEPELMKDFTDVQFQYSNRITAGEQQVLDFGILCMVRQPQTEYLEDDTYEY